MKKITFFLVSLLFTLIIMKVNAQDTCRNAVVINSIFNTQVKDTTISINSTNVCWAFFTANSNTNNLNFYRGANNTVLISTINLYHGNCDTLILDSIINVNDTLYGTLLNNLIINTNYFIKINFNAIFSGDIILSSAHYVTSCSNLDGCGPIKNGDFYDVLDSYLIPSGNNPLFGIKAFQNNTVCSWKRAFGEPRLPWEQHTLSFYASLKTNNNQSQAIYQNFSQSLPAGDYTVSMRYNTGTNIGELNVLLTNYIFPVPPLEISGNVNGLDNIPSGLAYNDPGNLKVSNTFSTNITPGMPCYYSTQKYAEYNEHFTTSTTYDNILIYPKANNSGGSLLINDVMITPRITFVENNPLYLCNAGSGTMIIHPNIPAVFANHPSDIRWEWRTSPYCSCTYNSSCDISDGLGNSFANLTINIPTSPITYYLVATDYSNDAFLPYHEKCRYYGSITIIPNPTAQTVTINGDLNNNCSLQGTFSVPYENGVTYTWTIPSGVTYTYNSTSGSSNDIVNITDWGNTGINTISVEGYSNGCLIYQGQKEVNPGSNCVGFINANIIISNTNISTSSIGGASPLNTAQYIYFDGVVHIDIPFTFENCPNIYMGPNAKIIIDPGYTLTINGSHIQGCCAWDGIYTQDVSAKLVLDMYNNTDNIIQDAKNAVVSENGGDFSIQNTLFVNNKIGIEVLKNFYNPHTGYIASSIFEWDPINVGPFSGDNHLTGIYVETTYLLTIGDKSDLLLSNTFRNIQFGIKTYDSDVNIYNNYFYNIGIISNNPPAYSGTYSMPDEAAIFSQGISLPPAPGSPIQGKVYIGDITNYPSDYTRNKFETCNIGIFAKKTIMDIEYNFFKDQHYMSIHLKDCENGGYIFKNEVFMNNSFWPNGPLTFFSAILAELTNTTLQNDFILRGNYITESHTGISLVNYSGNPKIPLVCNIENNQIYPDPGVSFFGIYAASGYDVTIKDNDIYSFTGGITLDNIQASVITNNIISNNPQNISQGIYISNPSYFTEYSCNTFNNCHYGFYFDPSYPPTISDNLPMSNNASDNIWNDDNTIPTACRRMYGVTNGSQTSWSHAGAINNFSSNFCPYLINPGNPISTYITPIPYSTTNNCGSSKSLNTTVTDPYKQIRQIIKDSIVYTYLPTESKYMAKDFVYDLLDKKTELLNMGSSNDLVFQNFYNTIKNANIGKLAKIQKHINSKNYNAAKSLNSSINPQNLIESNIKEVNSIYLNRIVYDSIVNASDSILLVNIAMQSPSTGGKAVYKARAILDLYPNPITQSSNLLPSTVQNTNDNYSSIKVYPNPANDKLYIELNNTLDGMAKVEFYDLTGKLIYCTSINTSFKLQMLNISNITKGIYNLRLTTNKINNNQKLVIIK